MARRAMCKEYLVNCPALCEVRSGAAFIGIAEIRLKQRKHRSSVCWEGKCSVCGRELRLLVTKRDVKMEKLAAQNRAAQRDSAVAAVTG